MVIEKTYTQARNNLASLCNMITKDRQIVHIHRRSAEDVAMLAYDEFESLKETAHLTRSSVNVKRLLTSIKRALNNQGTHQSIQELKGELDIQ